jgi:diphthine-ammonia ligase
VVSSVAASWSGGKDSCLACWKAGLGGLKVDWLYNAVSEEYGRVSFHGVRADLIQLQAQAIGVPLLQKKVSKDNYEEKFVALRA